jgi:ATP-binding cassette subfamily B protein
MFWNTSSGSILVDGQDLRELTADSLRRRTGVVPQEMVLFHESLKYNVHYRNLEATYEEVRRREESG